MRRTTSIAGGSARDIEVLPGCVDNVERRSRRPGSRRSPIRDPSFPSMPKFVRHVRTVRPARDPGWPVPLTLITGPANAAKVGAVLERLRAALPARPAAGGAHRAPTSTHYQRELAELGHRLRRRGAHLRAPDPRDRAPHGAARAAARAGRARPRRPRGGRRRPAAGAGRAPPRTPGFADAAGRAVRGARSAAASTPARFTAALRAWARRRRRARRTPASSAALYSAYRRTAGGARPPDLEGYAWAALDALRAEPGGVGRGARCSSTASTTSRRPSATPSRRSCGHAEADVCVALPYEPGRVAFAGRAATVEELRPLAAEVVHLPGALRALRPERPPRAAPPRALAVRAGARPARRRTAPCGCSRRAASARRPSSSAPRCSS